jgi:hypothetical protein
MDKGLIHNESDDHDDPDGILRTYSGRHTKEKLLPVREHLLVYYLLALISGPLHNAPHPGQETPCRRFQGM